MEETPHDPAAEPSQEATQAASTHPEWRRDHSHQRKLSPSAPWDDESVVWGEVKNPHRHRPWFQGRLLTAEAEHALTRPGSIEPDGYTTEFGTASRPFPHEVIAP